MTEDLKMGVPLNILYCHGLGSSINNRTGRALVDYFKGSAHNFERLVYRNPGSRTKVWRINEWREDIESKIAGSEWIVFATSAGGHAALCAARNRPENVKGLFLFCPGTGLDLRYVDTIAKGTLDFLQKGGTMMHPAARDGNEALVDLESFRLFMDSDVTKQPGPIPIRCPVHIVHGTADELVSHDNSIALLKRLESTDKGISIVEGRTHYLEFDDEIRRQIDIFLAKFSKGEPKIRIQSSKL